MRQGTKVAEAAAEMLADRERGVRAGTVLIDAAELAERIGYLGKRGARTVREKAAAGVLPCVRLGGREIRFHWPTVIRALGITATNIFAQALEIVPL